MILGVFLLQIQLLPLMGFRADLPVLATICLGFLYGWRRGLAFGLVSGFFKDVFSGGILGLFLICPAICGVLAGYSRRLLLLKFWIVRVGLVFILTLLNLTIDFLLLAAFHKKTFPELFNLRNLLIPLGNTIIAGILFWLMDRHG